MGEGEAMPLQGQWPTLETLQNDTGERRRRMVLKERYWRTVLKNGAGERR